MAPNASAPSSELKPSASKPAPPTTSASNRPSSTISSSRPLKSSSLNSSGRHSGRISTIRAHPEGVWPLAMLIATRAIRSCMINTPIATRPWKARSSRLLSSTLAASTVLENDSAIASSTACLTGISRKNMNAGRNRAVDRPKCSRLPPMTSGRARFLSLSLRPTVNSRSSTPRWAM